jgi:hypothetical protein
MDQLVSLHPEYMNLDYTYQPDSIKEPKPLDNLIALPEAEGLKIERSVMYSLENIPARERPTSSEKVNAATPLRKNIRQREQILMVGGSQFIEPRNEVDFVALVSSDQGLHLPQRTINAVSYDWITFMLLVALALFASVRTKWNKYMVNLFQSTLNYSTALRMYQEKNNSHLYGAFQLDVIFYLIISVFAFQVLNYFRIDLPYQNFLLFLFCLVSIIVFFLVKTTIYRFMGLLIEKKSETGEYLFNVNNFKRVAGLILLPLVAVIAFYPYGKENIPVTTGMYIVLLLYSLLVFRGFMILLRKQFSIFYLFLYFCTLEFLPLVLLYKILVV